MERIIRREAINLPSIMIGQMKETIKRAKIYLPYGMVFTLLFQAAHTNLNGEDERKLHHSDTYSAKSLMKMGYHLSNYHWKKEVSRQRVDESSSEDEEEETEEQQPNIEFVTEAATKTFVQEAKKQRETETQT